MGNPGAPPWLEWARRLRALSQTGLTYAADPFDAERYRELQALAAEMAATGAELEAAGVRKLFELETGHATPKVDVRACLFRGDSVLLVRERSDGGWTLPGGWAEPGDTPSGAVEREVREEAGHEVRAARLLALLDRDKQGHPPAPFYAYKLFFECDLVREGTLPDNLETDGVAFFPLGALPPLSVARVTPAELSRLWELHRHPEWPADFD